MIIRAETRDSVKMNKWIIGIRVFFWLYLILLIASIVCGGLLKGIFAAVAFFMLILLVPTIIAGAVIGSKVYKNTWTMTEVELYVRDQALYCKETKLHVNYNPKSDVLYVHDLGDKGNPSKASIYLTVFGDEKNLLMDYLNANRIEIEKESAVRGRGKFGIITTMGIGVSRYRRR